MKSILTLIPAVLILGLIGLAQAGAPTAEQGKSLFNDAALAGSTNSASCNTCHPDGRKLEKAGDMANLKAMINNCIRGALKGESLDEDSAEMESLVLYIRSLGK